MKSRERGGRLGRLQPFRDYLVLAGLGATGLLLGWGWLGYYGLAIATGIAVAAAVAVSWNIVAMSGQVSLGHAGFFGLAAYLMAMLMQRWGAPVAVAAVISLGTTMLAGATLAWICVRMRALYFAIATLGFSELIRIVVLNAREYTGGAAGILVPVRAWTPEAIFSLSLAVALGSVGLAVALHRSRYRFALVAMRHDQDVAASIGIPVRRYRILTMALGSGLAALAGMVSAVQLAFIAPDSVFSLDISLDAQIMALAGGIYTVWGPLVGAVAMGGITEWIRTSIEEGSELLLGVILVLIILYAPKGLLGYAPKGLRTLRGRARSWVRPQKK